jgi:hypothetical protein
MNSPWLDERIAPNGQSVRENFSNWFGDSVVVDASGRPLVVYHGTIDHARGPAVGRDMPPSTDAFGFLDPKYAGSRCGNRYSLPAMFLTDSAQNASGYAIRRPPFADAPLEHGTVYPVYLAMKTPLVVDAKGAGFSGTVARAIYRAKTAKRTRYDGVIIRNIRDSHRLLGRVVQATNYIVFDPRIVKSAIGNSGLYLPLSASLDDRAAALELERGKAARAMLQSTEPPRRSLARASHPA